MEALLVSTGIVALGEIGDKTQVATVALAARCPDLLAVVLGTPLGRMIANVPAVLLGDQIANRLSMGWVHGIAAAVFALLGVLTLLNVGQLLQGVAGRGPRPPRLKSAIGFQAVFSLCGMRAARPSGPGRRCGRRAWR
jgi:hypothetical protein